MLYQIRYLTENRNQLSKKKKDQLYKLFCSLSFLTKYCMLGEKSSFTASTQEICKHISEKLLLRDQTHH